MSEILVFPVLTTPPDPTPVVPSSTAKTEFRSTITGAPIVEKWIFGDTRGPGKCRLCGRPIVWGELVQKNEEGRHSKMPFTHPLITYGRRTRDPETGRPIQLVDLNRNHWGDCPNSKNVRARDAARRQEQDLFTVADFRDTTTMTTHAELLFPPAEGTPLNPPPHAITAAVDDTPAPMTVQVVPQAYAEMDRHRASLMTVTMPTSVTTIDGRDTLNAFRLRCLDYVKTWKPKFDEVCSDANKAHARACELRAVFVGSVDALEKQAAQMIARFDADEKRKRDDEARAAQQKAQADERARLDREAAARAKAGDKDGAAAIRAMPVQTIPMVQTVAPPKAQGMSTRTDWKWRPVTGDTPEGREMAAKMVPREYMTIDDKKLNAVAENHKGTVKVPGIEFYSVIVPVRR